MEIFQDLIFTLGLSAVIFFIILKLHSHMDGDYTSKVMLETDLERVQKGKSKIRIPHAVGKQRGIGEEMDETHDLIDHGQESDRLLHDNVAEAAGMLDEVLREDLVQESCKRTESAETEVKSEERVARSGNSVEKGLERSDFREIEIDLDENEAARDVVQENSQQKSIERSVFREIGIELVKDEGVRDVVLEKTEQKCTERLDSREIEIELDENGGVKDVVQEKTEKSSTERTGFQMELDEIEGLRDDVVQENPEQKRIERSDFRENDIELDENGEVRDDVVQEKTEQNCKERSELDESEGVKDLVQENSAEKGLDFGEMEKGNEDEEEEEEEEGWFEDWEGIERTELEKQFDEAVVFVNSESSLSNEVKMELYAFHKVATEGLCHEPQPMPFKVSARSKWNAWQRLGNMNREVAMEQYVKVLSQNISDWKGGDKPTFPGVAVSDAATSNPENKFDGGDAN